MYTMGSKAIVLILKILVVIKLFACVEKKTITSNPMDEKMLQEKSINSSCIASSECDGKLVCDDGQCKCSEGHFWNGNTCSQYRLYDSLCSSKYPCQETMICKNGRCQCDYHNYWNEHVCLQRISINGTCKVSHECLGKLICLNARCQCQENYHWKNKECSPMFVVGSPCNENDACLESLLCIQGKCQCASHDYWIPNKCVTRKGLNATCKTSYECFGKLLCIEERCVCGEQHVWNGTNCKTRNTINSVCTTTRQCEDTLQCMSGRCVCPSIPLVMYIDGKCSYRPRECQDLATTANGVYTIYPESPDKPVQAYCIIEQDKKWTVIQTRVNGSVNFYRPWKDYKQGFGSAYGEHWLGNDNIHYISTNGHHELSIYMEIASGEHHVANYSTFRVGDENSKYVLTVTGWSGTDADSMDQVSSNVKANGQRFSTKDQDNDNKAGANCAIQRQGGWWYNNCFWSDFNSKFSSGMYWAKWSGSITKSILMIRRT